MTEDAHQNLADCVELTIQAITALRSSADARNDERAAAWQLYDSIMNYRVLLRSRRLTGAVEFITPARGSAGAGWYYAAPEGSVIRDSRNWVGPFPSAKLARAERDKMAPKNRVSFVLSKIIADGAARKAQAAQAPEHAQEPTP